MSTFYHDVLEGDETQDALQVLWQLVTDGHRVAMTQGFEHVVRVKWPS